MGIEAVPARFWSKVELDSDANCWLWNAGVSKAGRNAPRAYFAIGDDRALPAARALWILMHGQLPSDVYVCHRCDVPLCVNPAHLFLGSHADNMRDAQRKGRLVKNLPKVARYYPRKPRPAA